MGPGTVAVLQILHGHVPGGGADAVVNDHVKSPASAFPAASFTPLAPPLTVAVYKVFAARAAAGVSVARRFAASYATVDVTAEPPGPVRSTVVVEIVDAIIASLNVAVTVVLGLIPVALLAGVVATAGGGAVSGAAPADVRGEAPARAPPPPSLTPP